MIVFVEKIIALGGVAIGIINAQLAAITTGSTKIITRHDLSLVDSSEQGASGKASNYELKTVVIDVAKRNLEIVGEKIYDSSVAVKDSIFTKISGLVDNEDISVSGTVSLTKADAGDHSISKDLLTLISCRRLRIFSIIPEIADSIPDCFPSGKTLWISF